MNQHTKGPWKTWGHNGCLVVDSNGLQVADTFHGIPVLHRSDAECRANAKLIASAPDLLKQRDELLEVVREFIQTMDSLPDSNETSLRVWDVYDTASKLIEKMQRGES